MSVSFDKWLCEVANIGESVGYEKDHILCFKLDLLEHWENDLTPQEAFDIEFVGDEYEVDALLERLSR